MTAGSNAHCEGMLSEPDQQNPRDTLENAPSRLREETEALIAIVDRSVDKAFAAKIWTIGNIFRESDAQERAALLEFVIDHWGPK